MRVLSFNISTGNISHWSPPGFRASDKYELVAQLIRQHAPHLVSLQEVGGASLRMLTDLLSPAGFTHLSSAESHCHSTHIWASNSLQLRPLPSVGPVAFAQVLLPLPEDVPGCPPNSAGCFYFAGCHLEPFSDGAVDRLAQIDAALRTLPPHSRLVLAGDTNMRTAENYTVEALGLSDAFTLAGSPREESWTWNSRINNYHGPDQRAYIARYDRVYLRGLTCTDIRLIANQPVTPGHQDYLSDHFGLLADVQLLPPQATQAA